MSQRDDEYDRSRTPLTDTRLQLSLMGALFAIAIILSVRCVAEIDSPAAAIRPSGLRVDLNQATAEELSLLPGIAQKTSIVLINHRLRIGGFHDWNDLQSTPGIGPVTVDAIRPYCVFLPAESPN